MKRTWFIFTLFALIFYSVSASAATMDLLSMFDTNSDGRAQFGDGYTSHEGLDYDEQEEVTELFNLNPAPVTTGTYSLTITFDNVQTNAYFNLNGTDFAPFNRGAGTMTYTGNAADLMETGNSLTFYVLPLSSSNLDDYSLSQLSLEYVEITPQSTAPVPEPGTLFLCGVGLIGLASFCRRQTA